MAVSKVRALGSEAMVIDGRDRFFTLTFPLPQKELMMREETLRVGLEACGWSLGTLRLVLQMEGACSCPAVRR